MGVVGIGESVVLGFSRGCHGATDCNGSPGSKSSQIGPHGTSLYTSDIGDAAGPGADRKEFECN